MKKSLLALLVLINMALLAALMTSDPGNQAQAQLRGGSSGYTAITVKIDNDEDAQFLIDPRTNWLFAMRTDTSRKAATVEIFGARDLAKDFPVAPISRQGR